jgi:hypothetical protein
MVQEVRPAIRLWVRPAMQPSRHLMQRSRMKLIMEVEVTLTRFLVTQL